jgi:two-component system, OmpR family, sensor kinase
MTRRRALALIFGALAIVFVIGSIITITGTRDQLIDGIDDDLHSELDLALQFYDSFSLEFLDEIVITQNALTTIIIDDLGRVEYESLAGPVRDPLPRPDLPSSRIIDRVGQTFTVDGTDGGPDFRVTVGQLDNGRYLALGAPLDEVRTTLSALARTLLITLFAMMAVLGAIFWMLLRATLRPYNDLVDTAEGIAAGDMDRRAERTTSNVEITRLTRSLNTMLDRLQVSLEERQAAEQRVKQFAADASHELRTPITTIAGYSELYLSGAATDDESVTKQMTRINSEAGRMGRLVQELLTLTRLDHDEGPELRRVDIRSAVATAVADLRATDPGMVLAGPGDEPGGDRLEVLADPDAIQQLMANLLGNAARHAPGAAVAVTVTADDDRPDVVVITVSDDGPGMAPEVVDKIFDRFYRADTTRSSSSDSFGLGLPIVAGIAESNGGSIDVASEPGRGSTFTVRLPLATPPASAS